MRLLIPLPSTQNVLPANANLLSELIKAVIISSLQVLLPPCSYHYRRQNIVVEGHRHQVWSVNMTLQLGLLSVFDHMSSCQTMQFTICTT